MRVWAAMVLAAGRGTRLAPLTDRLPKALVPIGDRPALAHVLERLARSGAARAAVNVHHLPEAFTPRVLAELPLPVDLIVEPRLLGTAGGVANAAGVLAGETVVAWNADVLADVDVRALVDRLVPPPAGDAAAAALAVAPRARGEGTVGLGAAGRVVRLRGERFGDEVVGGDFLGVQAIGPALRRRLPDAGCLVGDVYLPALRSGARIATVTFDVAWDDVGSVAAYLAANARWLRARGLSAHVGEEASVAPGVSLDGAVVGAGASVLGDGAVRDAVVWPGVTVEAPLERAVAFADGQIA